MSGATKESNMGAPKPPTMSDEYRALLTEREREILTGDADVSEKYYYRVVTRVRNKIEQLEQDRELLDRHHDTLGDELRDAVGATGDTHAAESATEADSVDFDREVWHDRLSDEVAGRGDKAARRADAILGMYDHLREHGEAETDTLRELPDPETVDYEDADSVWSNMVKGKDTLRALPGVEPPAPGTNDPWRYTGDTDT